MITTDPRTAQHTRQFAKNICNILILRLLQLMFNRVDQLSGRGCTEKGSSKCSGECCNENFRVTIWRLYGGPYMELTVGHVKEWTA